MSFSGRRVKTKTFTGCWTCRRRKVKCDEGRPYCFQCTSKHLQCGGYTTRLQWLPPESSTGLKQHSVSENAGMCLRRTMFSEKPREILSDEAVDAYLEQVDALAPSETREARETRAVEKGETLIRGPFGIFHQSSEGSIHSVGNAPPSTPTIPPLRRETAQWEGEGDTDSLDQTIPTLPDEPRLNDPDLTVLSLPTAISPDTDALATTSQQGSSSSTPRGVCSLHTSPASPTSSSYPGSDDVDRHDATAHHPLSPYNPAPSVVRFPFPLSRLPEKVEMLLHHYVHHVVDLMTVVPTPKGPWKSVHLPRALHGSAELAFTGQTSHGRNALFHALLTISAYNVAANHSITGQEAMAREWLEVALRLKARTLAFLKTGLQSNCPVAQRGKYKEILAVMLSMVTMDVCSGETRTSEWHLKGLESFIRSSQRGHGHPYSKKAQALHCVYAYLRIMRESTDFRAEAETSPAPTDGEVDDFMTEDGSLSRPLFFLDEQDGLLVADSWLAPQKQDQRPSDDDGLDLSACEFVYGLPFAVLVLMGKSSELVRRKRRFVRRFPTLALPPALVEQCRRLEAEILDWPIDGVVARIRRLPDVTPASRRLIEHQTRAFHQALIVYFSSLVRAVHRRHLQPYVQSIIEHLEAVEVIKHSANMATGCILWPGFIGASEATEAATQARYLQWFRATRFYGLGAYEKACDVVLEVWERQQADGEQASCHWLHIVETKDIRLMLT